MNSGDWNSGSYQTGYFNTSTPQEVLVFNKPCNRDKWLESKKPNFIFFELTFWVSESEMTDQEKIDNPKFYVAEGYLKTITMQEAWAKAWAGASKTDKELLLLLPNFDAKIFKDISGIDVNQDSK